VGGGAILQNAELNRRVTVRRRTPLLAGRVPYGDFAGPKTLEKLPSICHQAWRSVIRKAGSQTARASWRRRRDDFA